MGMVIPFLTTTYLQPTEKLSTLAANIRGAIS
jgi:hypothetical protein